MWGRRHHYENLDKHICEDWANYELYEAPNIIYWHRIYWDDMIINAPELFHYAHNL